MQHVITIFALHPRAEVAFARSLRTGGDWHTLAHRIAPDLVASDLLRHRLTSFYLCLDFWSTPAAYNGALQSPAVQQLLAARRQMASDCLELGAFSFPTLQASMPDLAPRHAQC